MAGMRKLIQGIVDFRKNLTEESRELFAKLALGQKPDVLFIACSDSRVVPNLFASTNPGDLFVLRNIGNLVPPVDLAEEQSGIIAALEFAVTELNVPDIVVCGHSECGAIHALAEGTSCPHLKSWLKYGKSALEKVNQGFTLNPKLSKHNQISQINVLEQMAHIASYPIIQKRLEEKKLRIHGWWFDIGRADVYCYEPNLSQFVLIDENEAELIFKRIK